MVIRMASVADVEQVVALIESAYRGPSSREGWTTEADLLDGQRTDAAAVAEAISRDDVRLLLAVSSVGELLGCCQLERCGNDLAYFGSFAVRPGLQSQGLGRQLLTAAEERARQDWNASVMEMTVIAQRHELISWYERRGYSLTGETRPFPYDDERAGLPRRPDLRFVVLAKRLIDPGSPEG